MSSSWYLIFTLSIQRLHRPHASFEVNGASAVDARTIESRVPHLFEPSAKTPRVRTLLDEPKCHRHRPCSDVALILDFPKIVKRSCLPTERLCVSNEQMNAKPL